MEISLTRKLRRNRQIELIEEKANSQAGNLRELFDHLQSGFETGEMIRTVFINDKELESSNDENRSLSQNDRVSLQTISIDQLILDEINESQIHFDSLSDLIDDVLGPLAVSDMKEISRLFVYLSSLLQWITLLNSNMEMHLREYMLDRGISEQFDDFTHRFNVSLKALLDFKDAGQFQKIGDVLKSTIKPLIKEYNEFFRVNTWR